MKNIQIKLNTKTAAKGGIFIASLIALIFANVNASSAKKPTMAWKIESKNATVYVLGSVHFGTKDMYPLPKSIENAYNESDTLVLEIDPTSFTNETLLARGTYDDTSTIKNHLSKEGFAVVLKAFREIGTPDFMWRILKPFPALLLYSGFKMLKSGLMPEYGIDINFAEKAKSDRKKILELENIRFQLELIDSLPPNVQEEILVKSIKEYETIGTDAVQMVEAWKAGDDKALVKMLEKNFDQSGANDPVKEIFVDRRNRDMLKKVNEMLESGGKYFVIVGAAHVIGTSGIVPQLMDRKDLKITRLFAE